MYLYVKCIYGTNDISMCNIHLCIHNMYSICEFMFMFIFFKKNMVSLLCFIDAHDFDKCGYLLKHQT